MSSNKKNSFKSCMTDFGIMMMVLGPLLFIVIGGLTWRSDGFKGTIMQSLFPALFMGLMCWYMAFLIFRFFFEDVSPKVGMIIATLFFILETLSYYFEWKTLSIVILLGLIGLLFVVLILFNIRNHRDD